MSLDSLSRRSLLQTASSLAAAGVLGNRLRAAEPAGQVNDVRLTAPGQHGVIVFQGDSITDEGRDKSAAEPNHNKALGKGYPAMLAGQLLADHASQKWNIWNRGISGNKIPDLAARWEQDVIALKPDVLSILIGVNDLWHTFAFGSTYKATIADYEKGFRELLIKTKAALPKVQIVICEPFTTRTSDHFKPLADYAKVAKQIAVDHQLVFVPFQSVFDAALESAPAEFWLWDGIHPTVSGHALMAKAWREATGI